MLINEVTSNPKHGIIAGMHALICDVKVIDLRYSLSNNQKGSQIYPLSSLETDKYMVCDKGNLI